MVSLNGSDAPKNEPALAGGKASRAVPISAR
jgi:hypothetical protein